ncbi:MAG: DNA/RNA nuclease SfsA [bacterium]|nr:DNA/RNA nuclease SfsA [bacterium]
MNYYFEEKLIEGTIVKRKSQFTMVINIDGTEVVAHCPTTGRIGDIGLRDVPCLVSKSKDPKRKTPYTVEAVSCDLPEKKDKNWIGINQILSNKLVEYFLNQHMLDEMVGEFDTVKREVVLGNSKLDFLVGNIYMEVKTPLTTLNVAYSDAIKTKKVTSFSSTERFTKHVKELAGSLQSHEKAILLSVFQYEITEKKERQKSTHYDEVRSTMLDAIKKGTETWEVSMKFRPEGVELLSLRNTSSEII